jgi:hypothetical protein
VERSGLVVGREAIPQFGIEVEHADEIMGSHCPRQASPRVSALIPLDVGSCKSRVREQR